MLRGEVRAIPSLTEQLRTDMFALMQTYYENITWENFSNDLSVKKDVILFCDGTGNVKGFSTLDLIDVNEYTRLLFSGDTIIAREYWGANDLVQKWVEYAFQCAGLFHGDLYWLLFSKGYKTYKYLPTFFHEFYPRYGVATPKWEQNIMDGFCLERYGDRYKNGIVKIGRDFLKEEVAIIPENKLKDRNTQFFLSKNPGYAHGDELVCLTKISRANLKKAGRKIVG